MRAARRRGMLGAMGNPYGITLDEASLRWAAAEGVPESVVAAICLLDEKSVDEIVAKLSPVELEQAIKIAGRSPQIYPRGEYEALKEERHRRSTEPPAQRLSPKAAAKEQAGRIREDTDRLRRGHTRRPMGLSADGRQSAAERGPYGITLDEASLRWAATEGVAKSVIAAICLLDEKSVDEIVAKLSPVELSLAIKIAGRSPQIYPHGASEALKEERHRRSTEPPAQRLSPKAAAKEQAGRVREDTDRLRRGHTRRPMGLSADGRQSAAERGADAEKTDLIGLKRGVVHARLLASVLAASQTSASNAGTMLCAGH